MIFKIIILSFSLVLAQSALAKSADYPKSRTIQIKQITESVISVAPARAVKFIFPWVLSEDDGELPFSVSLSNNIVFNDPITQEGQNVLIMTYKNIGKDILKYSTDLLISSRGYHFSFTLIPDTAKNNHYSTVVLKLSDADKLALINRELQRVQETLIAEKARLENDIDRRAEVKALALVGGLSLDEPDSYSVKEEAIRELNNGDRLIAYVNRVENFNVFWNFKIEFENDTNSDIYINSVKIAKLDANGNKRFIPSSYIFAPKLKPSDEVKGTLSVLNYEQSDEANTVIIFSTNKGDVEVNF